MLLRLLRPSPRAAAGDAQFGGTGLFAQERDLISVPAERAPLERCYMCGARLPVTQMVADGGHACADVRWYCSDTRSCTDRWTARLTHDRGQAAAGSASAGIP